MKVAVLTSGLVLVFAGAIVAQKSVSADTTTSNTTSVGNAIVSGTSVSGQLQSTLDVKKAKVGDQVILKTTKQVKQNGQVVIQKGSTLIGQVTQVQKEVKGSAGSSVGVMFDTLTQNGKAMPISAIITSVTQVNAASTLGASDDDGFMTRSSGTASSSTSASSGGLLGGVTNTTGGLLNTTTQTVGNVTDTVARTTTNTTGAVTGAVRGLTITQSTNASANGGSTLSTNTSNLRLEKGVTFNLSLSSSSSIGKN